MKKIKLLGLSAILILLVPWSGLFASKNGDVIIRLKNTSKNLVMGDTPVFQSVVSNAGKTEVHGAILYISLAFLKKGQERPQDLEDWSAENAVRISSLKPGTSTNIPWKLRLISWGKYGMMVTMLEADRKHPVTSDMITFNIGAKPTINPSRIVPVAIGVPLLLSLLFFLFGFMRDLSFKKKKSI